MTIEDLKRWAKQINPRLAVAHYSDHYIQFRLYDVSTWHWKALGVCTSPHDAHVFLRGLSAAAHVRLKESA